MSDSLDQYIRLDAHLYDAYTPSRFQEDVPFYVGEAKNAEGPVLELGCGTGRVTIPIAEAGVDVTGVDLSDDMLEIARKKIAGLDTETRARIRLEQGDMCDFKLDSTFSLAIIPFRAFLHLMTVEDQRRGLTNIRDHLNKNGRLIFNVFDPNLQIITDHMSHVGNSLKRTSEFTHPETGNRIVEWESRRYDLESQTIDEVRIYEEFDSDGRSLSRYRVPLRLRFVYRYEMVHLLELCGYKVDALYGDFHRGEFNSGGEQVWIASKS